MSVCVRALLVAGGGAVWRCRCSQSLGEAVSAGTDTAVASRRIANEPYHTHARTHALKHTPVHTHTQNDFTFVTDYFVDSGCADLCQSSVQRIFWILKWH